MIKGSKKRKTPTTEEKLHLVRTELKEMRTHRDTLEGQLQAITCQQTVTGMCALLKTVQEEQRGIQDAFDTMIQWRKCRLKTTCDKRSKPLFCIIFETDASLVAVTPELEDYPWCIFNGVSDEASSSINIFAKQLFVRQYGLMILKHFIMQWYHTLDDYLEPGTLLPLSSIIQPIVDQENKIYQIF